MSKSTGLKTRGYLFKEEELKESLPEIIFSTNVEIILHFQFRRSRDKITPTQKIFTCTIKHDHITKCSCHSRNLHPICRKETLDRRRLQRQDNV